MKISVADDKGRISSQEVNELLTVEDFLKSYIETKLDKGIKETAEKATNSCIYHIYYRGQKLQATKTLKECQIRPNDVIQIKGDKSEVSGKGTGKTSGFNKKTSSESNLNFNEVSKFSFTALRAKTKVIDSEEPKQQIEHVQNSSKKLSSVKKTMMLPVGFQKSSYRSSFGKSPPNQRTTQDKGILSEMKSQKKDSSKGKTHANFHKNIQKLKQNRSTSSNSKKSRRNSYTSSQARERLEKMKSQNRGEYFKLNGNTTDLGQYSEPSHFNYEQTDQPQVPEHLGNESSSMLPPDHFYQYDFSQPSRLAPSQPNYSQPPQYQPTFGNPLRLDHPNFQPNSPFSDIQSPARARYVFRRAQEPLSSRPQPGHPFDQPPGSDSFSVRLEQRGALQTSSQPSFETSHPPPAYFNRAKEASEFTRMARQKKLHQEKMDRNL